MKKSFYILAFFSLIVGLSLMSCGPSKKFTASQARVDRLQKDNALTVKQLDDCSAQVRSINLEKTSLQKENEMVKKDLRAFTAESKYTIEAQATRLRNMENMIQSQKAVTEKLKNSISNALMNYNPDELSVYTKDGNVYVSLSEKLLFKSGSDVVDPKGKSALKSLAQVLNTTKDITVLIEGHTDNVPIKTREYMDNWDLSTARATSIVRILTIDNGFDSNRIIASGRGIYHPVKPNDSVAGRAANRRTEVILSPDLDELFKLLYQ